MSLGFLGSIIFQHDRKFILNRFTKLYFGDSFTHTALILEKTTKLHAQTQILNTAPVNNYFDVHSVFDILDTLSQPHMEYEVWTPIVFDEGRITQALSITLEEALGKKYAYLQLFTYFFYYHVRNFVPTYNNPYTDGLWCGEYVDIFLNALNLDPNPKLTRDEIRPQELRDFVANSGVFIRSAVKSLGDTCPRLLAS